MKCGAFTGFGFLRFGGTKSVHESIYDSLVSNWNGALDVSVGTMHEALLYAEAYAAGCAANDIERASFEAVPSRAYGTLSAQLRDYRVPPDYNASIGDLRSALAVAKALSAGGTRVAIDAALRTLLGSDFVWYRTTHAHEIVTHPASPQNGPGVFSSTNSVPRVFTLTSNVAFTGIPVLFNYTTFTGLDDGERLFAGDVVSVGIENTGLAEKVTIASVSESGGVLSATATFTKAKDVGASVSTGPTPYWTSNQRDALIVLSASAAADREKRRLVDEFMQKVVTGTSTWAIAAAADATHTGTYTTTTPLGTQTLGPVTFP